MRHASHALDRAFHALADASRRSMIERLSRGPASASEIGRPFDMSLCALMQRLKALEAGGLVRFDRMGRPRMARIEPLALTAAEQWIKARRTLWRRHLDHLQVSSQKPPSRLTKGTATMTDRSVTHAAFTLERRLPFSPGRVYRAFSEPELKDRWFTGAPGWVRTERSFDFRVGGVETSSVGPEEGPQHRFTATYHDIRPKERIIYTYVMHLDDALLSVSTATIEIWPEGAGARLCITEQGAFVDHPDAAGQREQGARHLMDALEASLAVDPAV